MKSWLSNESMRTESVNEQRRIGTRLCIANREFLAKVFRKGNSRNNESIGFLNLLE